MLLKRLQTVLCATSGSAEHRPQSASRTCLGSSKAVQSDWVRHPVPQQPIFAGIWQKHKKAFSRSMCHRGSRLDCRPVVCDGAVHRLPARERQVHIHLRAVQVLLHDEGLRNVPGPRVLQKRAIPYSLLRIKTLVTKPQVPWPLTTPMAWEWPLVDNRMSSSSQGDSSTKIDGYWEEGGGRTASNMTLSSSSTFVSHRPSADSVMEATSLHTRR